MPLYFAVHRIAPDGLNLPIDLARRALATAGSVGDGHQRPAL